MCVFWLGGLPLTPERKLENKAKKKLNETTPLFLDGYYKEGEKESGQKKRTVKRKQKEEGKKKCRNK